MNNKTIFLSAVVILTTGLVGCQTVKHDQAVSSHNGVDQVNQAVWEKSGQVFEAPNDMTLAGKESRAVFYRQSNDDNPSDSVNITVGNDHLFQTSLKKGHYSDVVICDGSQVVKAKLINSESGVVQTYGNSYDFSPQVTTYLQVNVSKAGKPVIQQISSDQARLLLNDSTRQTHQISRVLLDCSLSNQTLTPQSNTTDGNLNQFKVLFDFDSTEINSSNDSNNYAALDGMANFIQSYPKVNIVLEGHTDSKGPESYNLRLSQSRANTVKDILVSKYGFEPMRLSVVGYGESKPIYTNSTTQGRQNNRRVVAIVSQ